MRKTTLYLTRHGQTLWNVEQRLQGHKDSPLTDMGVSQALWLRDALAHINFSAVYTSPSPRAYRTAEMLRHERTCPFISYDDLREMSMGSWEGERYEDLKRLYPDTFDAFWNKPHLYQPENGGESATEVQKRVVAQVHTLIKQHEGETILVVTHGGTLNALLCHFEPRPLAQMWEPPHMLPTSLSKVIIEGQSATIELYGDTSHYQDVEMMFNP